MKRYTIHGVAASQGKELENQPYTACKDQEGLWVKWEDVKNLLNNLGHNASVAGFHHRISQLEDGQECNCAGRVYSGVPLGPTTWICPAHGLRRDNG